MATQPLTPEEQEFIKTKFEAGWSDKKIAEEMKRSKMTVLRHRERNNIERSPDVKVIHSDQEEPKTTSIVTKAAGQELEAFKKTLLESPRYKRMKSQLTKEELAIFIDLWASFCCQFEDMTAAEELILENMITYQLRIDANRRAWRDAENHEVELKERAGLRGDREFDLENEADRFYYEMSVTNNNIKLQLNKDFKELTDKYSQYFKMMNATREQRESNKQIGADTFLSLVRQFNDRDRRIEAGKYNERMKLAASRQKQKMAEGHKFMDGEISPIIMDGKDYIEKEDEDTTNG